MEAPRPEHAGGTVACSQCGGENELPSGQRLLRCAFCGTTLFVDRSGVISHYRLPRLLDEGEARAALQRWMAGNETVKNLDRKSTIEGLTPVSFPMWLFRVADASGERVLVEPAAPTPIPQLADLKVPAGRLEPFRSSAEGVEAVEVTVPLETAAGWLRQKEAGEIRETALVQVPLWRCRYSYRGQAYVTLIDASTGAALASIFPEKSESPYYLVAGLGLLLFGAEGLLIGDLMLKLLAYVLTAIPLSLLAYWVARRV